MPARSRSRREILEGLCKTKKQTLKDYVAFLLLAGPSRRVFAGNMTAN